MMTVTGSIEGTAYVLTVKTPTDGPETVAALRARMPGARSLGELLWGTEGVIDALGAADGAAVMLSPTGPERALSAGRPETVLAWLRQHGDVASVTGAPAAVAGAAEGSGVVC